ncbi:MAG: hypothetical protein HYZ50_14775 [Deltaproteobacteria bacterium]|nr:hypothetical protein [Deltaproteobacteria bacterium]
MRTKRTTWPPDAATIDRLVYELRSDLLKGVNTAVMIHQAAGNGLAQLGNFFDLLTDAERAELEAPDLHPGRASAIESFFRAITPSDVNSMGVILLATTMERFLGILLTEAVRSGLCEPSKGNVQEVVRSHMRHGLSHQLAVIMPITDLAQLHCFPKYRELRATRNAIVHTDGVATSQYVDQTGPEARGGVGESLEISEAYFRAAVNVCMELWGETDTDIRRKGEKVVILPDA